ncbi:prolipoprotein diacylglyceryl transferase [Ferruginibacter albus]|uniref:prolipoprotein diacylglyceryl transferase n=1 Tax=Ferruginibacter albus TaxID=2875540 RepID=UPI001CC5B366|nr:prolipoprotein diacylglyceryl transferase family protein [Ferruginibacter albus]UAY51806.1 prolipoprotein diacylglyceryl transferase [Ferruginibacter albus]
MNFPVMVSVGGTKITLHLITEILGFFIGFRYFLYLKRKQGDIIEQQKRMWVLVGAIFGALIGSRLVGSLERPYELFRTKDLWEYIYNNKTVLGGFLGGLLGVELMKKIIGEKQNTGDLFTYPIILALMVGRIGCFSMGIYEETYGSPTHFFTGMNLGDGILRHPVALYEIVFLLLLCLVMLQLDKRYVLAEGARFKLFLIAYCMFRFLVDFIKPRYFTLLGLSTIQLAALLGLIYYYKYLLHPKKLLKQYA